MKFLFSVSVATARLGLNEGREKKVEFRELGLP